MYIPCIVWLVFMQLLLMVRFVGLNTVGSWFDSQKGQEISPFSTATGPVLGPNLLPFQWILSNLSPRVKRPDHSLPQCRDQECTSAPPYTFTTAKIQLFLPYVLFFHMAALRFFTYWKLSVLSTWLKTTGLCRQFLQ